MLKPISLLQILHTVFLATVPIGVVVVAMLPELGFVPVFDTDSWELHFMEASLGFFTIIDLVFGYYWPRLSRKAKMANKPEMLVVVNHTVRIALFQSVAIYGLVLGILGSSWYICLPFFLLSGIALILTFPTEERWNRWMESRSKP